MSSSNVKLRAAGALAVLAGLALAVSCRGFFVKPTLSSLAVGPATPNIFVGTIDNTVQMFAVGTFNDGSTGTTPVTWSITPAGVAEITAGGLATAQTTGTATITATSSTNPAITGTQPLTVSIACTSAITITPSTGALSPNAPSASFTASCNGGQDITDTATWVSSNTTIATVSAGVVTATQTAGADGTFTITASSNGVTSNAVSITATGF
jgi:trimeric autotransporter adhesin